MVKEFIEVLKSEDCKTPKMSFNKLTNETLLTWRNNRDLCIEVSIVEGKKGYSYIIDDGVHCDEVEVDTDVPTDKFIKILKKEMA